MKRATASAYAVAAVFTAALTPVGLLALRALGAPDFVQGLIVGLGIGATLLLCALALRLRTA